MLNFRSSHKAELSKFESFEYVTDLHPLLEKLVMDGVCILLRHYSLGHKYH